MNAEPRRERWGDTLALRAPAALAAGLRRCKAPGCAVDFHPAAVNQLYCCAACRRGHDRLLTQRGRAIIEALMEHFEGKSARPGSDRAERAAEARRFVYQSLAEFRDADRASEQGATG